MAPTRPTSSPNLAVAVVVGILGFILLVSTGRSIITFLLGLAALVCSVVGLARNEPSRFGGFIGLLCAVAVLL